jgi:hypothetical protein
MCLQPRQAAASSIPAGASFAKPRRTASSLTTFFMPSSRMARQRTGSDTFRYEKAGG